MDSSSFARTHTLITNYPGKIVVTKNCHDSLSRQISVCSPVFIHKWIITRTTYVRPRRMICLQHKFDHFLQVLAINHHQGEEKGPCTYRKRTEKFGRSKFLTFSQSWFKQWNTSLRFLETKKKQTRKDKYQKNLSRGSKLFKYSTKGIFHISINLLVVYRESVNLIGCLTRRLSADSLQLWIANENQLFRTRDACFTPQCTSRAVFETFELPL